MKYRGYIRIGFKTARSAYKEAAFTSYSVSEIFSDIDRFAKCYGINLGLSDISETCADDDSYENFGLGSDDSYLEYYVRKVRETDI